jgi:hypothetical protein
MMINKFYGRTNKMTRYAFYAHYQDCYEYHGSTTIERTRKEAGRTVKREWILFDSVEEALEFFNNNCGT